MAVLAAKREGSKYAAWPPHPLRPPGPGRAFLRPQPGDQLVTNAAVIAELQMVEAREAGPVRFTHEACVGAAEPHQTVTKPTGNEGVGIGAQTAADEAEAHVRRVGAGTCGAAEHGIEVFVDAVGEAQVAVAQLLDADAACLQPVAEGCGERQSVEQAGGVPGPAFERCPEVRRPQAEQVTGGFEPRATRPPMLWPISTRC